MMTPDGIGTMLRDHREAVGLSRMDMALLLQNAQGGAWFDVENLKRWETERRLPTPRWHSLLAAAYGRDEREIAHAVANSRRWRRSQEATGGQEDENVKRRQFLGAAAAVTGTATGIVALPGIAEARDDIDRALSDSTSGDLAYLEGAFENHRGGYRGRAPDDVLAIMCSDLGLLGEVLARPHPAATRAGLARSAAGITGLVAIIQHDRGDQRDAHGWFATAERAARESGDRHMLSWVLARHAMVPLNYKAPRAAADLASRARAEAGRTPTAAAALAAAVAARALASVGDQQGALRAVADARTIAERLALSETADTWFGYPAQKHHVHLSQAFTLMGRTRDANDEQQAALALTRTPSVMTRALLTIDAATCMSADGDHDGAAELAAGVWVGLPHAYRDGLVRTRVNSLHNRLNGRAYDRLAEVLSA
ncbi:helix-turn-helix domain-containing protein [Yinghuangia soli]|uniref:Helix-turn-helix domain-containing protein n=1 Tax=Yinghuangia soli TaxID=2908204 RepID=A0AA41QA06_9ACTN|nr:helix-turn-helix domain-containing protein [Yinghuangia soli]MCF2534007.1 helix-turn-helix domain-containing protein [Yinghuangia soli]